MGNRGTRNTINLNNNNKIDDNEISEENDVNLKQPGEELNSNDKYHTPYFKVPVEYPKEITKGNDQLSSNRYILYMIIEYLDIQSLCRFSQCCWYFKQIADQDKYWKPLYFKYYQNSITVVPSLERWNFENSTKNYLKLKFSEDYEQYKKRIVEYNERMDLDLVRFDLKHKIVRFPGKFVIKIIPKGRRWKYMLQIASKYKYISEAYLQTKPHDYVFIPAGRYNCNDWSSDFPSQWGGLKINNPVHFIGEEKTKGNVSVFIESTDNRPLEWNAIGGSCSNIYFHQHQYKRQYYTHAVSIREGNVMFKNCRFTSDSITSVRIEKNTISKFIDCHFLKSNHAAISIEDCSTIIDSCWFYENNLTGIEIRKVPEDLVSEITSSSGSLVQVVDKESKNNIIIQNCRIFNNEGGGIEITEDIYPIVKNNHIYDNKEFGIEIRLGDGMIEGNTIKDNKTFGIIAWTTSQKKRRQFEDLLKKNRVIDNLLGDCSAKVIPPTQKSEDNDQSFDYFITSALKDKICTFGFTGRHFHKQNWYRCITCNLVNNLGCCEICVKTCHEKCEVEFQGVSTAYCDCYFSGSCLYAPNQEREMKKITTGTPIIKKKENETPQEKESEKNEEMDTSSESEDEEKEDNYLNQSQLLLKIQNAEDGDEDFLPF